MLSTYYHKCNGLGKCCSLVYRYIFWWNNLLYNYYYSYQHNNRMSTYSVGTFLTADGDHIKIYKIRYFL